MISLIILFYTKVNYYHQNSEQLPTIEVSSIVKQNKDTSYILILYSLEKVDRPQKLQIGVVG
jgi:hypothetical protein